MLYRFISEIGFVEYYIFLTVIIGFICADYKKNIHRWLLVLLFTFFVTEIVLIYANAFIVPVTWIYAPGTITHNIIWLSIFMETFGKRMKYNYILFGYTLFSVLCVVFYEGFTDFNTLSFVIGAALYMFLFIREYIGQLNNENFAFFQTNESLLLFAPILFFMGLSIMFSFNDNTLFETKIIGSISMYYVAVNFPNLICYSILNIYFFKEKQLRK